MAAILLLALLGGAPATPPAEPSKRVRLLVLEPTTKAASVDPATLATLGNLMIVELSNDGRLEVVSAEELKRLADLESDRQAAGCAGEPVCLAELADAMGARYVLFGDVGTIGTSVIFTLNLFDSQRAQAVNRTTVQARSLDALPGALPPRLKDLVAPLVADAPDATPPKVLSTSSSGPGVWPFVWIGAGVAVAGAGVAVDVLPQTAKNGRFDLLDVAGPALYVGGAAAVVTGAILLVTVE